VAPTQVKHIPAQGGPAKQATPVNPTTLANPSGPKPSKMIKMNPVKKDK
jgi:hypothetical protein